MARKKAQRLAGQRAKQAGDRAEIPVDFSMSHYERQGLACGEATSPAVRYIKGEYKVIGKGGPDRRVTLAEFGGKTCWLEIKTWQAKDRHSYSFIKVVNGIHQPDNGRIAQFEKLQKESRFGALACYIVCWRWRGQEDWRLYPVEMLERTESGILFLKADGLPVDSGNNWPDWLPVASQYLQQTSAN